MSEKRAAESIEAVELCNPEAVGTSKGNGVTVDVEVLSNSMTCNKGAKETLEELIVPSRC